MNNRVEPEDPSYEALYKWWLNNGKPRKFNQGSAQWLALTDNDRIVFLMERYTGIDSGTSFNKVIG